MHVYCFWLGVLAFALSAAPACWAQTPGPTPLQGESGLGLYLTLLLRESCDVVSPGFKKATSSGYERWRRDNEATIAALETSAEFRADLDRTREHAKTLGHQDLRKAKENCAELADALEVRPRDSRLATPNKTWELFLASLRAADRATAIACLTSTAKRNLKETILRLPDEGLHRMGDAIASFNLTKTFGGIQEAIVVRHDGTAGLVYFEERNGEWRISEM